MRVLFTSGVMTMSESIEEDVFHQFHDVRRRIEKLTRDPWITAKTACNLRALARDLDEAWAVFQRCERTDNGPTRADIAGEVRHDVG
jgi:hypothetical protein